MISQAAAAVHMARHLICLTIDTDPDGITAQIPNRHTLEWHGLEDIEKSFDALTDLGQPWGRIPITWFVRADAQIRENFGSALYLVNRFEPLWSRARALGHEFGWHPHLYRAGRQDRFPVVIADPKEAAEQLEQLWGEIAGTFLTAASAFRNGEGWHCRQTFRLVEQFGFRWDSTAIPGRKGTDQHPMDWIGTPNYPYHPGDDIRLPGPPRPLLEIPITTWLLQAPYDSQPRRRYLNPAVHETLFHAALSTTEIGQSTGLQIWTLVSHPDEVSESAPADLLYSRSARVLSRNLSAIAQAIRDAGNTVEFVTVSQAGEAWLNALEEKAN